MNKKEKAIQQLWMHNNPRNSVKDKTKKEESGPGGDRTLDLQFTRQIRTRLVFLFENKKEKAIQQLWMHNYPRNSVKDKTKISIRPWRGSNPRSPVNWTYLYKTGALPLSYRAFVECREDPISIYFDI